MTLMDAVIARKCRHGKAAGTTKEGAYWLAGSPVIRRAGGDGIGENAPDLTYTLELRHYRDGTVMPTIHRAARHQNGAYAGAGDLYYRIDLCLCETAEEVIVALKGCRFYSDQSHDAIVEFLSSLGMPESAPAPDEE